MMGLPQKPSVRRLLLFVWILVGFFYFYLSYDYIRVSIRDGKLSEYLDHVVELAGNENRPAKEVRTLILVKAEELRLPLRGDQIEIRGGGQSLNVNVNYQAEIEVPFVERVIYTKDFHHKVAYHQQR